MASTIEITAETMNGNFKLVRVIDTTSSNIILFGMYRGGYEGRLVVPPQSTLTTSIVSQIHSRLTEKFPNSVWTVNFSEKPKKFDELRKLFEETGIREEVPEDGTEDGTAEN